MSSEWMQVMLEEIARKQAEAAEARAELEAGETPPKDLHPRSSGETGSLPE